MIGHKEHNQIDTFTFLLRRPLIESKSWMFLNSLPHSDFKILASKEFKLFEKQQREEQKIKPIFVFQSEFRICLDTLYVYIFCSSILCARTQHRIRRTQYPEGNNLEGRYSEGTQPRRTLTGRDTT